MFRIRAAAPDDLDALMAVSEHLDSVNLPSDREFLAERIARSQRSFAGRIDDWRDGIYVFALEDTSTRRCVGTSTIVAKHGRPGMPYFWLAVTTEERRSVELGKRFVHTKLQLDSTEDGPTEIGGLILDPAYRRHPEKAGKALSIVRLAYISMHPTRFERAVIFMIAHSEEGAMGLIVNKPAPELSFADLLAQLKIPATVDLKGSRVHFGGPVEHGRGFVLHSGEYKVEQSSMRVSPEFAMTATIDILQDIARGEGPNRALLALGYAGWGPGQLEGEIQANGWLTAPADPELIFGLSDADKWGAALRSISIDPRLLSAEGGRA